jgi:hypothetical protein
MLTDMLFLVPACLLVLLQVLLGQDGCDTATEM